MQQCKVKLKKKKNKERPHTEHQQRHQKGPNGAPGKVPKNTFGRQPAHGKVGQFRLSLSPCALCKKNTIRDHKRSTERPEVLPKRSTSKSNQRAQTKHQKVQSEATNGAPERPEVLPKQSTSKSNQRAQTKHQKVQSETTNGAPE